MIIDSPNVSQKEETKENIEGTDRVSFRFIYVPQWKYRVKSKRYVIQCHAEAKSLSLDSIHRCKPGYEHRIEPTRFTL